MAEIKFADALRYVFSGVVLYAYWYVLDPTSAGAFAQAAGTVGFPIVLAVAGCLTYFTYRPLIYEPFVQPLHRRLVRSRKSYVQALMEDDSALTVGDAARLYRRLRDTHLSDQQQYLTLQSAGIHMTYLSGILAIPFAVAAVVSGEPLKAVGFLVVAGILITAGLLNDASVEEAESDMVMALDLEKRRAARQALRVGSWRDDPP